MLVFAGRSLTKKPRGHVITVVQIGKLILIVRVREFLANGTFTRQVIDV